MDTHVTPFNALTGIAYQGGNIETLVLAVIENGFGSLGFVTYRQALEMGRVVRKGQKSPARVTRWFKVGGSDGETPTAGEVSDKKRRKGMTCKSWAVFNLDQTEVLEKPEAAIAA